MPSEIVKPQPADLAPVTPMGLLQLALEKADQIDPNTALTIIKELKELQNKERDYQARVDFDVALNECQAKIGRIAPNASRENNIKWADYAQIDRHIRPIYTTAGFSIAFSEDGSDNGRLRMRASLSRGGVSKDYFAEIAMAAANTRMSQMDVEASAASRVKRYLLLDIFNIAIGIDKDEKAPYEEQGEPLEESVVMDFIASIEGSGTREELQKNYLAAANAAKEAEDSRAADAFVKAKNATWRKRGFHA